MYMDEQLREGCFCKGNTQIRSCRAERRKLTKISSDCRSRVLQRLSLDASALREKRNRRHDNKIQWPPWDQRESRDPRSHLELSPPWEKPVSLIRNVTATRNRRRSLPGSPFFISYIIINYLHQFIIVYYISAFDHNRGKKIIKYSGLSNKLRVTHYQRKAFNPDAICYFESLQTIWASR